jgi:hypothetical protein
MLNLTSVWSAMCMWFRCLTRCMNGGKGVGSMKADLGTTSGIRIYF